MLGEYGTPWGMMEEDASAQTQNSSYCPPLVHLYSLITFLVSTSNCIVEADDSDTETDTPSQLDSPQLYKLPMEEVIEEDVDVMEMECD